MTLFTEGSPFADLFVDATNRTQALSHVRTMQHAGYFPTLEREILASDVQVFPTESLAAYVATYQKTPEHPMVQAGFKVSTSTPETSIAILETVLHLKEAWALHLILSYEKSILHPKQYEVCSIFTDIYDGKQIAAQFIFSHNLPTDEKKVILNAQSGFGLTEVLSGPLPSFIAAEKTWPDTAIRLSSLHLLTEQSFLDFFHTMQETLISNCSDMTAVQALDKISLNIHNTA